MLMRRFGRTGHQSSIAIFGGAAFGEISQQEADKVMEMVIDAGINHIDVAPSYGQAEIRIGPWMPRIRDQFFLGCKTMERTKAGAWNEMQASLERLQTKTFDLYQFHAVTSFEELDQITMKGGALEAVLQARDEGLTQYIGITGHGKDAPAIYREALRRFDFDTVLFPLNFVQMAIPEYRQQADALIQECNNKDVGTMVIKSITKAPWGNRKQTFTTWYEPFNQADEIQRAINFALSYPVTGICTVGDVTVLPMVLEACQKFAPMTSEELAEQIELGKTFHSLFE